MTYRGRIRNGVAILDEGVEIPEGTPVRVEIDCPGADFWAGKSVEQLAREQGVRPCRDVAELAGTWPDDEPLDEFLQFLREARR